MEVLGFDQRGELVNKGEASRHESRDTCELVFRIYRIIDRTAGVPETSQEALFRCIATVVIGGRTGVIQAIQEVALRCTRSGCPEMFGIGTELNFMFPVASV